MSSLLTSLHSWTWPHPVSTNYLSANTMNWQKVRRNVLRTDRYMGKYREHDSNCHRSTVCTVRGDKSSKRQNNKHNSHQQKLYSTMITSLAMSTLVTSVSADGTSTDSASTISSCKSPVDVVTVSLAATRCWLQPLRPSHKHHIHPLHYDYKY